MDTALKASNFSVAKVINLSQGSLQLVGTIIWLEGPKLFSEM